jgi:hypothetical protein
MLADAGPPMEPDVKGGSAEVAMLRKLLVIGALGISLLVPSAASAITVDQVVALAKSGVTDTVILALIDRDRTVFAIEPEQIVSLQRDGLSEQVILAMLRSGRDEGEQAARADSIYNAGWIASTLTSEPASISVGHGPERPNTPHIDGFYSGPPAGVFYGALPWGGRSLRGRADRRHAQAPAAVHAPVAAAPMIGAPAVDLVSAPTLCLAQISTQQTPNQPAFVTACPAVMQPRLR